MTNSKQKNYLMTDYPMFVAHCFPFFSEVELCSFLLKGKYHGVFGISCQVILE